MSQLFKTGTVHKECNDRKSYKGIAQRASHSTAENGIAFSVGQYKANTTTIDSHPNLKSGKRAIR
ncbi:unnamed protein product, partial [Wuchereria bancrofti]